MSAADALSHGNVTGSGNAKSRNPATECSGLRIGTAALEWMRSGAVRRTGHGAGVSRYPARRFIQWLNDSDIVAV